MSTKKVITILKAYQKAGSRKQKSYLKDFTEKMVYRTTKTENPETTKRMVKKVLSRTR
jgi:hypothetical protein